MRKNAEDEGLKSLEDNDDSHDDILEHELVYPEYEIINIEENDKLLIFLNPKSLSKIENLFK